MFLDDIEAKLLEIDPKVCYGAVDDSFNESAWDYIVFNRTNIRHSTNHTSNSDFFDVHVVRENYIPDGLEDVVINKLCELSGIRLAGADSEFDYAVKPRTNIVVEMMTIHFVRARKSNGKV